MDSTILAVPLSKVRFVIVDSVHVSIPVRVHVPDPILSVLKIEPEAMKPPTVTLNVTASNVPLLSCNDDVDDNASVSCTTPVVTST